MFVGAVSNYFSNCLSVSQQPAFPRHPSQPHIGVSFSPSLFVPRMLRAVRCPPAGVGGGGGGGEGCRTGGRGGEVQHPRHEGRLLPSDQNSQYKRNLLFKSIPWCYAGNTANDEGSPAVCINSLAVLRPISVVCLNLHRG